MGLSLGLGRVSGVAHTGPAQGTAPSPRVGRAQVLMAQGTSETPALCLPGGRVSGSGASGMGPALWPGASEPQPRPCPCRGPGSPGELHLGKGSCPHTWLGSGCRWVAGSPGHAGWEHACPVAQSAHTCGRGGHVWAGRTHAGRGGAAGGVWMPRPPHTYTAHSAPRLTVTIQTEPAVDTAACRGLLNT